VAPKRRAGAGIRAAARVAVETDQVLGRTLSRAEEPAPTLALVPATVVGAELAAVIRPGEVTVELTSTTPNQNAAIAQALARPTP